VSGEMTSIPSQSREVEDQPARRGRGRVRKIRVLGFGFWAREKLGSRIADPGFWIVEHGAGPGFWILGPRKAGIVEVESCGSRILYSGSWNMEQVLGVPVLNMSHRTAPIRHGPPPCTLADPVPGHRAPARRGHPVLAQDVRREHVGRQVQQGVQVQYPAFVWPGREAGELSAKEVRERRFLIIRIFNPHPRTHAIAHERDSARTRFELSCWDTRPWRLDVLNSRNRHVFDPRPSSPPSPESIQLVYSRSTRGLHLDPSIRVSSVESRFPRLESRAIDSCSNRLEIFEGSPTPPLIQR
jgi:hypothetical protein